MHAFPYVFRLRVEADWDHWISMQEFAMAEAAIKDKIKISNVFNTQRANLQQIPWASSRLHTSA